MSRFHDLPDSRRQPRRLRERLVRLITVGAPEPTKLGFPAIATSERKPDRLNFKVKHLRTPGEKSSIRRRRWKGLAELFLDFVLPVHDMVWRWTDPLPALQELRDTGVVLTKRALAPMVRRLPDPVREWWRSRR